MTKKQILSLALAAMVSVSASAFASTEIHENKVQTDLVNRIRTVEQVQQPKAKESIKDRVNKIMVESKKETKPVVSKLPKVAVMYVNNAKSTYDAEVDKKLFKYLNKALPANVYDLVDGSPYIEVLNKMGIMDVSMAERADFVDAYEGSDVDYVIYLEVQPFIARDKITFFTIGKDITTSVPFRMLNLATGKYLYNGKYTEKGSDSSMIGGIGNKSVALKVMESIGDKIMGVIQVRLPKEKATVVKK